MSLSLARRISYIFILCSMMGGALMSCAQISSPQGGPQDSLPPMILDMNPMPYQTNFDGKKILIKFDEYVQLKDQQKQFTMSPPSIGKRPVLTVKGKSIEVLFEEPLDSATTYKLDFGNSIVDFNESNPLSGFSLIFSTGDYIDSLIMVGQTVDALSQDSVIGALMFFYDPIKELQRDSVRLQERREQAVKDSLESLKKMQQNESSSSKRKSAKKAAAKSGAEVADDSMMVVASQELLDLQIDEQLYEMELPVGGEAILPNDNVLVQNPQEYADSLKVEVSNNMNNDSITDGVKLDSMLFLGRPEALFRTDSSGVFFADILKDKSYKIYAVQDNNGNQTYDPGADLVGFIDATFNPTQMAGFTAELDSLTGRLVIDSLQLRFEMFKEEAIRRQVMLKQQRPMRAMIQFSFAAPNVLIDTLELDGIDSSWVVRKFNAAHDTLNVWINTPTKMDFDSLADTIKGRIVYQRHDSVWNLEPYAQRLTLVNKRPAPESSKDKKKKDREEKRAQDRAESQHQKDSIINQEEIMYSQEPDQLPDTVGASPLVELRKTSEGLEATNQGLDSDQSTSLAPQDTVVADSLASDSTNLGSGKEKVTNPFKVSVQASQPLNPIRSIGFAFEYPLQQLDSSRVSLIHLKRKEKKGKSKRDQKDQEPEIEEVPVDLNFEQDSINPLVWTIRAPWEQGEDYKLTIPDSVFVDYAHHANDTLQQKFTVDSQDKYGMFSVNLRSASIDSVDRSKYYIVELVSGKGDKIKVLDRRTGVKLDQILEFKFIKPDNYRLRVIEDKNGNKKWDTGVLTKGIQPEKVRFWYNQSTGSQNLIAKENWEVEVPVDVDLLFAR